jgi:hypothetical protein
LNLSVYGPAPAGTTSGGNFSKGGSNMRRPGLQSGGLVGGDVLRSAAMLGSDTPPPGMDHRISPVSSKGGIGATFRVPGVITIPSDGAAHKFFRFEVLKVSKG